MENEQTELESRTTISGSNKTGVLNFRKKVGASRNDNGHQDLEEDDF